MPNRYEIVHVLVTDSESQNGCRLSLETPDEGAKCGVVGNSHAKHDSL